MAVSKKKTKLNKDNISDSLINVNLQTETSPIIQEVHGKNYIEFGVDKWKNLYPQFLIDLYYSSSTHSAIIKSTADMIAGEGITIEETDNLQAFVKLKKFQNAVNSKGETLHSLVKKLAFDFKLFGGYAINVVWSRDKQTISELYHVPLERIRIGKPDVIGRVTEYYISADWSNTRKHKPQSVPAFNINDRSNPNAIIYDGSYSPNMELYKVPDYVASCNWALVDSKISEYHLANIENSFSLLPLIIFSL